MNLAVRDIRHNSGRFVLTCIGVGLLLMVVLGMGGIYNGMVDDAKVVLRAVGADLWVVQRDTRGPLAEISRIPASMTDRVAVVPGVQHAREFVLHTIQRSHEGQMLRLSVLGLHWPLDRGDDLPLIAGRSLRQGHWEMIADASLGLALGTRLRLGRDRWTVVGLTRGMVSFGGDGIACVSGADARAIQFDESAEAMRLERNARVARSAESDTARLQPQLLERAAGPSREITVLPSATISAVLVHTASAAEAARVKATLSGWADVTVHTAAEQEDLVVKGNVDRARRQLLLFRVVLTLISGVVMALIIYTLTIEKLHPIALLKLLGAPDRTIVALIMQQALLMGAIALGMAHLIGSWIYPFFPRRVLITSEDLLLLAAVVLVISVGASLVGIRRAMRVSAAEAVG